MKKIERTFKRPSRLQVISFITGFALMTFELVAARILAPTIGSSTYVWTSVIGIIIAALSLGYWIGGKVADRRNKQFDVALLCLGAAIFVTAATVLYPGYLSAIAEAISDTRIQGVVASLVLFAPASFILGMIGPYLAKLAIVSLQTSGQSVAGLSALNSLGGILGTFITGFIIFSYIGSRETLFLVVLILVIASWLILPKLRIVERLTLSLVLLFIVAIPVQLPSSTVAAIDSPSAHYEVIDSVYDGKTTRLLTTGPNAAQSGVMLDQPDELAFWYTKYAAKVITEQNPERILILGGGAFTLPGYLAKALPNSTIDVVEIDPALYEISKEYFMYEDHENVNLYFQDARTYVNQSDAQYDLVFVDVYGDASIPFTFLTKEFGEQVNRLVASDGVVVSNVIGGSYGVCRDIISAIDAMYRPNFPTAHWQTRYGQEISRGNYILVHARSEGAGDDMQLLRSTQKPALTDNFAPAEQMSFACEQRPIR